jgi:DNA-binding NarL/FixJ family response regulator
MAARRTDMHRLQEVTRLHRMGESVRRIARQLALGRNTIREYLMGRSTVHRLLPPRARIEAQHRGLRGWSSGSLRRE